MDGKIQIKAGPQGVQDSLYQQKLFKHRLSDIPDTQDEAIIEVNIDLNDGLAKR